LSQSRDGAAAKPDVAIREYIERFRQWLLVLPGFHAIYSTLGVQQRRPFDERLRRLEDLDWFIRFGQRSGHLHVLPYVGVIVAPSYSGSFDAVDQSTRVIEAKFNACSDTALPPSAWRRLQAYLALERGAALLREGETLKGLCYLLFSFWHKPRLQGAVKPFWERSSDVPPDVLMMFAEMAGRV
jgi:hypothetical protein